MLKMISFKQLYNLDGRTCMCRWRQVLFFISLICATNLDRRM